MTIRAAVTVALALGLVGASLPAVEQARLQHAESRVAGELDRLERAATALAAENDLVGTPPARARLTLYLPHSSWGSTGLASLRLPPTANGTDVRWAAGGGRSHARRFDVRLAGDGGGLAIEDGGRHRLVLELHRRDGRRTVVVRRPSP